MMTVDSAFITGIAKVAERLIILLDVGKVLTRDEHGQLKALPTAACRTWPHACSVRLGEEG